MLRRSKFRERQPLAASRVPVVMDQLSFLETDGRPEGLRYQAAFLAEEEEQALLSEMAALPFRPFEFQGFLGKRETVSFGWAYRFDGTGLAEAAPIPD